MPAGKWAEGLVPSLDGHQLLISSPKDYSTVLWDTDKGAILHDFGTKAYFPSQAAFSPDGKLLAVPSTGLEKYSIRVFELASQKALKTFETPMSRTAALRFCDDGKMLVAVNLESIMVLDLATGAAAGPPASLGNYKLDRAAISGDGKTCAITDGSSAVIVRDTLTAKPITTLDAGANAKVRMVAISPDGKWVATGAHSEKFIRIWDAATGKPKQQVNVGFEPFGRYMAFSKDSQTLYLPCRLDKMDIRGCDVQSGKWVSVFAGTGNFTDMIAISGDGSTLFASDMFDKVKRWKLK